MKVVKVVFKSYKKLCYAHVSYSRVSAAPGGGDVGSEDEGRKQKRCRGRSLVCGHLSQLQHRSFDPWERSAQPRVLASHCYRK